MGSTWWNRRAIGLHITAIILIPTFLVLGDWQLHRALGGNSLSWAYTFEWPIFAVYGTYMWWKLVHDIATNAAEDAAKEGATTTIERVPVGVHDARLNSAQRKMQKEELELAGYNAYLAQLRREDEQKRR